MKDRALPVMALLVAFLLLVPADIAAASRHVLETSRLVPLSSVLHKEVRGPRGILLGAVEDVILGRGGAPTFLVLSRGSAFGDVGPFHIVPWKMAAAKVERAKVVIGFGPTIIHQAPAVRMRRWRPDAVSPGHLRRVLAYYRRVMQKTVNP